MYYHKLSNLGKAAMIYARNYNFSVFPAAIKGKTPATANGLKDATTDATQIYNWWYQQGNYNVAIRTGKISNLVVIDVDGAIGRASLAEMENKYGKLPRTVEAITGGGGRHLLFKYPTLSNNEYVKSSTNIFGQNSKVDVRGDGGYIIAAPSIHENGTIYEWDIFHKIGELEIADLPKWLYPFVVKMIADNDGYDKKSSAYWGNLFQGVNKGGRNSAAASLAGYLFRRYLDPSIVYDIMCLWNTRNMPPLATEELERVLKSVWTMESRRRQNNRNNEIRW